jgi:hypothetical protein
MIPDPSRRECARGMYRTTVKRLARSGKDHSNTGQLTGRDGSTRTLPTMSGVSAIETDLRFSGREDFWIIVAARSEDETEIRAGKAAGGRRDQGHSARDPSTLFS